LGGYLQSYSICDVVGRPVPLWIPILLNSSMDGLFHKSKAKLTHAFDKFTGPQTHHTHFVPMPTQRLGTETDIWRMRKQRGVNLGETFSYGDLIRYNAIRRVLVHSRAMDCPCTFCERRGSWTGGAPCCSGTECKRDFRASLGHLDHR
jgi:hypothetical protein